MIEDRVTLRRTYCIDDGYIYRVTLCPDAVLADEAVEWMPLGDFPYESLDNTPAMTWLDRYRGWNMGRPRNDPE